MPRWWKAPGAVFVLLFAVSPLLAQTAVPPEVEQHGYADMVVINGKVVSMDDNGVNSNVGNVYEAMAVKKSRIIALGTSARIRALAGPKTRVIDLQGWTVIPGIIETHAHLWNGPADQMGIKSPDRGVRIRVEAGKDFETTRLRVENGIKDAVSKLDPGDWVMVGVSANEKEGVSGGRVLTWLVAEDLTPRARLDRVAPENPVLVQAGTRGNLNTQGLEITKKFMPNYEKFIGESLGKEYSTAPEKGLVGSMEMTSLSWEMFYLKYPVSLLAEMVRRGLERTVAFGTTTFATRVPLPRIMDTYMWLDREKQMPLRLGALYEVHRFPNDPQITRQFYKMTGNLTGMGNDMVWIHGVASERWDTDFPQICLGADVEAPPAIKKREVCPDPGDLWWDVLQNALEAGWRLAGIHGEGSDGVRRFTKMIEAAMKNNGMTVEDVRKLRMTVEHSPAIGKQPDLIERLKKYNIIVSASPGYLSGAAANLVADYGPAVIPFLSPIKTLIDSGVRVVGQGASGSKGRPWLTFMTREVDGVKYLPEEAVDRVTIIKMWTTWASEYVMRENDLGSLQLGKLADFVVLDRDFFKIPEQEILDIRPEMTVVGGVIKHLDTAYAAKLGMAPVGYQFPQDQKPWSGQSFDF
ncbi:MAG: amidohydrolase family protein [Acidobacteria bacterium]|nr:amidohydrolase family protein [Acidobacteriota bacterium]